MRRCKACNNRMNSSTSFIRVDDERGFVAIDEDCCPTCKGVAFSFYNYTEDKDYNMDWYQEGLTLPKNTY